MLSMVLNSSMSRTPSPLASISANTAWTSSGSDLTLIPPSSERRASSPRVAVGAGDVTKHAAGSAIPRRLALRWPIRSAGGGWWFGLRRAAGALRVVSVRIISGRSEATPGETAGDWPNCQVEGVGEKHESHRKERTLLTERTPAVDVETTARRDFSRTALDLSTNTRSHTKNFHQFKLSIFESSKSSVHVENKE